jgi:hypothetical protein
MEYTEHLAAVRREHPDVGDGLPGTDSLEHVLDWMKGRGFPAGSVDIVGQDEFSYDFLIRLEEGGRWLVFGVN